MSYSVRFTIFLKQKFKKNIKKLWGIGNMDVSVLIIKFALGILAGEEQGPNCIARFNGNRFF